MSSALLAAGALSCNREPSPEGQAQAETRSSGSARGPSDGAAPHRDDGGTAAATDGTPDASVPPEKTAQPSAERIYSKVRFLWVRPAPRPTGSWLGYLSLGDSVALRGGTKQSARVADAPVGHGDCRQWYAVEPVGYLCEGSEATTDPNDPLVVQLRQTAAVANAPWPYQYGESLSTPVYPAVPDEALQQRSEPDLAQQLERVRQARSQSDADRAEAWRRVLLGPTDTPPPPAVELHPLGRAIASRVAPSSTIAYTRAFDAGGRSWLLTWDWGVVPADRVRRYEQSAFHGVVLDATTRLPLAFFRGRARPKYRQLEDGSLQTTGASWPRQGWVALADKSVEVGGHRYLQTAEDGLWCAEPDATVVRASEQLPPRIARATEGRRTWVEVSVLGGWLVAYEAERPVFATLIAPGRGGIPYPGVPAIDTASTPVGHFTVTGKFITATMVSSSDSSIVHAEVPYTQNFSGPHALHGAYWHDDWGEPKSGGCVNLSPLDAQWVFEWTEPQLPTGWHAVRWVPHQAESTAVWIHR